MGVAHQMYDKPSNSNTIDNEDVHSNSINNVEQNVNNDYQSTENIRSKTLQDNTKDINANDKKEYVAGTTWVFDDGSQVILKPTNTSMIEDDDPESFYHEFENTTGGENFDKKKNSAFKSMSSNQQDSNGTLSTSENN